MGRDGATASRREAHSPVSAGGYLAHVVRISDAPLDDNLAGQFHLNKKSAQVEVIAH